MNPLSLFPLLFIFFSFGLSLSMMVEDWIFVPRNAEKTNSKSDSASLYLLPPPHQPPKDLSMPVTVSATDPAAADAAAVGEVAVAVLSSSACGACCGCACCCGCFCFGGAALPLSAGYARWLPARSKNSGLHGTG